MIIFYIKIFLGVFLMKKFFSVLLSFALVFSIVQVAAFHASAATSRDFTYTVDNSEATITGYTGVGVAITIPNTLDGYSVTGIGDRAFADCMGLTSVSIPASVTSIGDFAFYLCTGLTSVSIPASVTSIGDSAFYFCTGLTSISI